MDKRIVFFCYLLITICHSFASEHKKVHHHIHQPRPIVKSPEVNDLHIIIDVPDRPQHISHNSPHTPDELKKWKAKLVAATAIVTALITGAVYLSVHLTTCK